MVDPTQAPEQPQHGNWFTKNFDPLSVGLGFLANGSRPAEEALAMGLLQGRQQRLGEATSAAERAAAAGKAKEDRQYKIGSLAQDYRAKGQIPTFPDENSGLNPYMPTVLSPDPTYKNPNAPQTQFGVNPTRYYNPKTKGYGVMLTNSAGGVRLVDNSGKPVKDPENYVPFQDPGFTGQRASAGAQGKVLGETQGTAQTQLPGAADKAAAYKDILSQYMSYYPVYDKKTNTPIDPLSTDFNPETMRVVEKNPLASGITAGLPSLSSSGREIDTLRTQVGSREFLDQLIGAKAQGATFGSLTEQEGAKVENYRSIIASPSATARQRVIAVRNLNKEIDKAAVRLNRQAEGNFTAPEQQTPSVSNW